MAALLWLLAFPSFIRASNLSKHKLELVPDIHSKDPRCGFELFEPLYKYVLSGAVLTAIMALFMHLQNVYLRAPDYSNIFEMVFGVATRSAQEHLPEGNLSKLFGDLISVKDALQLTTVNGINLQFAVTALGLFIIIVIVTGTLVGWLNVTAHRGADILRRRGGLTGLRKKALYEIQPWPVPSIPIWFFVAFMFLIILSMVYVNLLAVVLIILFGRATIFALKSIYWARRRPDTDFEDDPDVKP